jgi:hypothetical protein
MPVHHGTDVLYQNAINSYGVSGKISTVEVSSPPSEVATTLSEALEDYGEDGEALSSKPVYLTTITTSGGSYSYYGAVSSLGRSAVYVNADTWDEEVWLLGPAIGVFPV